MSFAFSMYTNIGNIFPISSRFKWQMRFSCSPLPHRLHIILHCNKYKLTGSREAPLAFECSPLSALQRACLPTIAIKI